MPDEARASALGEKYDTRPDPQGLTSNPDPSKNTSSGVDYEPHPEKSIGISAPRQRIIKAITGLYCGSKSEEDIMVYAKESIYDDPWSYCDTRYKIAGQWWGIAAAFASLKTLGTEVVESTPTTLIWKQRHEYTPRLLHVSKPVNSLITLTFSSDPDEDKSPDGWKEKVKYHKDMWNDKDYSHEGIGKVLKGLNGDYLTWITRPPNWL